MDSKLQPRTTFLPFGVPAFGDEEIEAVTKVLRSGWVGMGPETIAFEKELGEYISTPYVVTVNSCTSALFLSLLVNGIGPGDEVICPSLTWCSTVNAIVYLGATPVFCDVDSNTLCLTPEIVLPLVNDRTKALMVVHMGGLCADVMSLRAVLPETVQIVEDAAHALGSHYHDGVNVGASGNLTCFSFYANKNLSTGEGGAIATFDADIASRLKSLRQNGLSSDVWKRFLDARSALTCSVTELGYKMNYMDLLAVIGRVQLRRLDEFAKKRFEIARVYHEFLISEAPNIEFQKDVLSSNHARHLFIVKLPIEEMSISRDELLLKLRDNNIGASIHYTPLHHMPYYKQYQTSLPVTDLVSQRILTLPISASMSPSDAEQVACHLLELVYG